ncbi:hypothetical protein C0J52_22670 [Blattella germanica]|nr:hypothetical protein C0J52_22670 [Blattella germanica]
MRWFQGGIAEAIATSKARNAVFVVFVHGKDEVSQDATRVVNSQGVSSKLESEDFVAITLDNHLVPVPSLFFIGENGLPLEVIAGRLDEAELVRRIESVLEKNKAKSKPAAPVSLSTEEKVDRAKELLEAKRKQKQEEEEEKQRQKEIERRKTGQDVQKLRRWQQDQELKQLKEERQREKAEEAAARERILKQIAQDSTSNVSRIQFRLPDGSAHSNNFEPTTTLAEGVCNVYNISTVMLSRFMMSFLTPLFSLFTYLRNLVFGGGGGGSTGAAASGGAPEDVNQPKHLFIVRVIFIVSPITAIQVTMKITHGMEILHNKCDVFMKYFSNSVP